MHHFPPPLQVPSTLNSPLGHRPHDISISRAVRSPRHWQSVLDADLHLRPTTTTTTPPPSFFSSSPPPLPSPPPPRSARCLWRISSRAPVASFRHRLPPTAWLHASADPAAVQPRPSSLESLVRPRPALHPSAMADDIDSLVKGAPVATPVVKNAGATSPILAATGKHGDPLNHTPSSPSMIYLNLLILEASLRAQYLELRSRRRHHTFFFVLLTLWIAFFGYKLRFATREDGVGVGGSIYWAVEGVQKVCFMGGIVTAILVWATGIWERGIRWPRRWFAISNRGLRGFNCKLVIIRRSWWAEALSTVGFFLTYGLFSHTASSSYRYVEPQILREVDKELRLNTDNHPTLILPNDGESRRGHEEDLAPGCDYVKLLLLPKPFSATFRENWELYRAEYWEKENERRALLRKKVKANDRRLAKQQYGWLWWLPRLQVIQRRAEPPKIAVPRHLGVEKERKRRSSVRRGSTSSSRSPTPNPDTDDPQFIRKASSSSNSSDKRRKKRGSMSKAKRPGMDSRSATPEIASSPLAKATSSFTPLDGDKERHDDEISAADGTPKTTLEVPEDKTAVGDDA